MSYVWQYISHLEYACPCCSTLPPDFSMSNPDQVFIELFEAFKEIREEWGNPIKISSGYRCPSYNEQVGGVPLSIHISGLALDLDCKDTEEVHDLVDVIQDLHPELRRGAYSSAGTFIHIDCGYLVFPRFSHNWEEGLRWYG